MLIIYIQNKHPSFWVNEKSFVYKDANAWYNK